MSLRSLDFESSAYTDFATPAGGRIQGNICGDTPGRQPSLVLWVQHGCRAGALGVTLFALIASESRFRAPEPTLTLSALLSLNSWKEKPIHVRSRRNTPACFDRR